MIFENYYYFIITMIFFMMFFSVYAKRRTVYINGVAEERWDFKYAFMLTIPLILWSVFREVGGDTAAYQSMFINAPSTLSELSAYVQEASKDKGFFALMVIFRALISRDFHAFFALIAITQCFCLSYIYSKYSSNYMLSILLFIISTDYIAWMNNGMRQFFAVSIVFMTYPMIMEKKYIPAIILTLFASQLHATVLVVIPFFFICQGKAWNLKSLVILIGVIISLTYLDQFTGLIIDFMEDSQYKNEIDDFINSSGTNYLRTMVYCIPALLGLLFKNRINQSNDSALNYAVNMTIVSAALYVISSFTSGMMFGRLPIAFGLYGYITIPWILKNVFTENSQKDLIIIMLILYSIFFYYQMHIIWRLM